MEYYNNEDFINYQNAFRKGYNYVLYGSEEDDRKTPTVNFNDLESIGYCNGFQYGEYCEITSQTMSISDTQLIAIIDKSFSRALEQRDSYIKRENQYVIYKTAFVSGKSDVFIKYFEKDESFNAIPLLNATDISSIGYYDGYCFYLNKLLNVDDLSELEELPKIEEICRENFDRSEKEYHFADIEMGKTK